MIYASRNRNNTQAKIPSLIFPPMNYEPKNYAHLLGTPGFSEGLLKNHFALYEGYVANVNKLRELLAASVAQGKSGTPEYAEMKRRFGWEWNGMRLHEYYFGNISGEGGGNPDPDSPLAKSIVRDFGTFAAWEADFKATSAMRGIGWVVLAYDRLADRLFNVWINEHDTGHLAGATPILVLDVFEHAYMLDYGIKRADYITAFMNAVYWKELERRFADRTI